MVPFCSAASTSPNAIGTGSAPRCFIGSICSGEGKTRIFLPLKSASVATGRRDSTTTGLL